MIRTHAPVHPVLRTPRDPHPWVRRRRRIAVPAKGSVAVAPALVAAPPPVARSSFLFPGAGCREPQSPAAGALGRNGPATSELEPARLPSVPESGEKSPSEELAS